MLRKFIALSAVSLSLLAAKAARADWYMISEYDFTSYTKSTDYEHSGGRGGYVAGGHPYVRTMLHLPIGKTITSLYCQVLDVSTTSNITVTLDEVGSPDDASNWSSRQILSFSSSGSPGHVKLVGFGSAVVKDYECLTSSCTYYTYSITVYLPATSNTNIKSCALYYQ